MLRSADTHIFIKLQETEFSKNPAELRVVQARPLGGGGVPDEGGGLLHGPPGQRGQDSPLLGRHRYCRSTLFHWQLCPYFQDIWNGFFSYPLLLCLSTDTVHQLLALKKRRATDYK